MTLDVAVLGSANVDMVLAVDRFPGAGETIIAAHNREVPGGKGLNQAVASARAGAGTAFVAAVGRDPGARLLLDTLARERIDAAGVKSFDAPTGRAVVVVQPSGENTIFVAPGANALLELDDADRDIIARSTVLVAQLEVPLPVVTEAFRLARRARVTTVLNAAPATRLDADLLENVDVLVVNEHEAMLLAGDTDPLLAAESLVRHVEHVVVTLGAQGATHVSRDGTVDHLSGLPAHAIDTTGAGDTFVGVLAASLAVGLPLRESLERSVAAGSLAVERPGATTSVPTRVEIDQRLLQQAGPREG
jgi:ribokinase